MAADTDTDDPDTEALAEAVVAELDTGTVVDDKIVVSRRGLSARWWCACVLDIGA